MSTPSIGSVITGTAGPCLADLATRECEDALADRLIVCRARTSTSAFALQPPPAPRTERPGVDVGLLVAVLAAAVLAGFAGGALVFKH